MRVEIPARKLPRTLLPQVSIFIILAMLSVLSGCERTRTMAEHPLYSRVLLMGIDGMDPKIISRLMEEGKLPHFKKLSEDGSFFPLGASYRQEGTAIRSSFYPHITIATGVNPGKHGIFDFIGRDASTYLPHLTVPKAVEGKGGTHYESPILATPLWRITSEAGVPTTVLRWPVTFPSERVKGDMLSGLGTPDIRGFLSGYTYYLEGRPPPAVTAPNKALAVEVTDGTIKTKLFGPKARQGSSLVELEAPIELRVLTAGDSPELIVDGVSTSLKEGEWSDWVAVSFRAGPLRQVRGIFKAYLLSTSPFEMYVGTIQIDPRKPLLGISSPRGYSAELARDIGVFHTLGMPEETAGYEDSVLPEEALITQIAIVENERERMFWNGFDGFKSQDSGLFAFVFDSLDRVEHLFWSSTVLEPDEGGIHPTIEEYYLRKDRFLGEVLRQLDNRTLLLIVSDHGFTSFERTVNINTWLVKNGFMALTKEIEEGDEGALFRDVDWSRTQAYSVGFSSIYVNLVGREGEGIVGETDRERVVTEIINRLMNLTDERYGVRPVYRTYRREEIYSGPYLADAPDIVVGFRPGYRMDWQSPIGGFTQEVIEDNQKKWKGDHLVEPSFVPGVLFSNAKLVQGSASQVDVAPTVLDALGMRPLPEMDGRSLLG